ncbi:sensor histidine kinase [Cellulomonas iranensis]|uniref:sensor histidine kinase n=1 Tax=Cellulomonas iranensis TaxID=76862 RepID=UPI003D7CCBD8
MQGGQQVAATATRTRDEVEDRRALLGAAGVVALGYAFGAALQSSWIYSQVLPEWGEIELWRRLSANGVAVTGLVVALVLLRVSSTPGIVGVALRGLGAAIVMGALRVAAQVVLGVYPASDTESLEAEAFAGTLIATISAAIGVAAMLLQRRSRAATRAAEREAVSVEMAVRALEDEEIRVRRAVAEGLHGTLQQRLVLVDARLDAVQAATEGTLPAATADVRWVRSQLAEARDLDVRRMSRLLYPDRLELGVVPAVRALLGRLPATIATNLQVGEGLRHVDDPTRGGLTIPERLLVVRVVEEAVTNALKHGPPSRVDVRMDVTDGVLDVVVVNDGGSFDAPEEPDPTTGTARLAQRLRIAGGSLHVGPGPGGGAVVDARLPLGVLAGEDRTD